MKATKANDSHHNVNSVSGNATNDPSISIDENASKNSKCASMHNTSANTELLKYNADLVQLEVEDEDDGENCISVEQADGYEENDEEERDLTNLTWLTELRNQAMTFVNMALSEETEKDNNGHTAIAIEQIAIQEPSHLIQLPECEISFRSNSDILVQKNQIVLQNPQQNSEESAPAKIWIQPKRPSPSERYEIFLNNIKRDMETYEESAISYESDIIEKPPFNYSHIIGMAMLENGKRVTLQQICSWIERKFAFFRVRKKWNNSIRHNLSLHPCFRKIGRNKEDKGKGGYWELGVDPKKCDRKRIRNRKSTAQTGKMQKKHLQGHYVKTTKRRHQTLASMKKCSFKCSKGNVRNLNSGQEYEELMPDDMDAQHNIDAMSVTTCTNNHYNHSESHAVLQQIHSSTKHDRVVGVEKGLEEKVIPISFIDNNEKQHSHLQQQRNEFKGSNKYCTSSYGDIRPGSVSISDQTCQQQQYKLGTIIISSANMDADMPNIQNRNQRTINSFLANNSTKHILTEQLQSPNNICYSEVAGVPQTDNVILSSCISALSESFSSPELKSYQCQKLTRASSSNSITLDVSASPVQNLAQKPNIIVEQLIHQPSLSFTGIEGSAHCATTLLNSSAATKYMTSQNEDYADGLVNEHCRPYIDGIDEAFKFLRSIDNTRNEDILDNLLGISVSDY